MIAGFKVAIALAVVGAVVGEFVGSRSGLGYYMLVATGNFDTPLVFACVVFLTLMGIILFYTVGLLEVALGALESHCADRARSRTRRRLRHVIRRNPCPRSRDKGAIIIVSRMIAADKGARKITAAGLSARSQLRWCCRRSRRRQRARRDAAHSGRKAAPRMPRRRRARRRSAQRSTAKPALGGWRRR